jgi:hypothetical protein
MPEAATGTNGSTTTGNVNYICRSERKNRLFDFGDSTVGGGANAPKNADFVSSTDATPGHKYARPQRAQRTAEKQLTFAAGERERASESSQTVSFGDLYRQDLGLAVRRSNFVTL